MKCCDIFSFLCLVALLSGCATADVMLMDTSKIYPPTENVHIIFEEPTRLRRRRPLTLTSMYQTLPRLKILAILVSPS